MTNRMFTATALVLFGDDCECRGIRPRRLDERAAR